MPTYRILVKDNGETESYIQYTAIVANTWKEALNKALTDNALPLPSGTTFVVVNTTAWHQVIK